MKKKVFRIVGFILLGIIILVLGAGTYVKTALPNVPLTDVKVEVTPERVARGSYLFHTVAECVACHSLRDENLFAMPIKEGTEGGGGETFNQARGFPGSYTAPNLTPYHLGNWTDGEIFRAVTSGVSKDGHALFPVMPYLSYGKADKEDIYAIIAYLRTLKPIQKDWPASVSEFPMSFIIHTMPAKADLQPIPSVRDTVNYGRYLVSMANCITCHSQFEQGKIKKGLEFAGGRELKLPTGGTVASANLTPDAETGLGNWSKEVFIQRFRAYADCTFQASPIEKGAFNTIMPWTNYAKMTTTDLAAIYAYLHSLKPVKNKVVKFKKDQ